MEKNKTQYVLFIKKIEFIFLYINKMADLVEENESLKLQIKALKLQLDYDKHMFNMAWQLLLSYSQWYKIPECLTEYFTLGKTSNIPQAHVEQFVGLNEQRKERLLHSMLTVSYLNHTFEPNDETIKTPPMGKLPSLPEWYNSKQAWYSWYGYRRPNRDFPLRTLTPYADTDCATRALIDKLIR